MTDMFPQVSEAEFEAIRENRPFTFDHFILTNIVQNSGMIYHRTEMESLTPGTFAPVTVFYEDDESDFAVLHRLPLLYGGETFEVSYFSSMGPLPVKFKSKRKAKKFVHYIADKRIVLPQVTTKQIPAEELLDHARKMAAILDGTDPMIARERERMANENKS